MSAIRTHLLPLVFVAITTSCTSIMGGPQVPDVQSVDVPHRVFFVGNSFTYYNDSLHNHVGSLLRAAGRFEAGKTKLRAMTISGSGLAEHLPGLEGMLGQDQWDLVIMHGYSNGPIHDEKAAAFTEAAEVASELVRKRGSTPAFLMTWAYKDQPEMAMQLSDAYTETGNDNDALVIPVGRAFARASVRAPEIELYSPDILGFDRRDDSVVVRYKEIVKHPSLAGTYLAACVVYASVYGESPVGLAYDAGLPAADAARLQSIAWKTVSNYYDK